MSSASDSDIARLNCGVLVLGAGLAGMRAAWAAKQAAPHLRVLLASPRRAPSGSSFANSNNALGVQAPSPDAASEARDFAAEALALAPPGEADPELVRVLAEDAPARVAELLALGLNFRREAAGPLARFSGCFSPSRRALVFDGLRHAHAAFSSRLRTLGVEFLHGFEALALHKDDDGRVQGARLCSLCSQRGGNAWRRLDVRAGAVVAAMGGPAPLFARRMCGPGGSGLSYGLLASAGARLVNARYLQFFWLSEPGRAFVNPGDLQWPAALAELAAARRGHCPVAYGLPDSRLDQTLLDLRGPDGVARPPAGGPPLALHAHAGNGGAEIDAHGRTTTAGLYACGECAGGMHGANRMGGAMVLACLVFGARAGAAAARKALGCAAASPAKPFAAAPPLPGPPRDGASAAFLRRLRQGMDKNALPGQTASPAFLTWLQSAAAQKPDVPAARERGRLLALSALAVVTG